MPSFQKRANVRCTKYVIVKNILESRGFSIIDREDPSDADDLIWMDAGVTLQVISKLKQYQIINHYPEMAQIYRKDFLARNLMKMRSLLPREYNFFPETYNFASEYHRSEFLNGERFTFIAKPSASSQGKGVFLFQERNDEFNRQMEQHNGMMIIQRYIHNPYLIDGYKFDMRIYVLVYSMSPLSAVIFKDGLARFSTREYMAPQPSNLNDKYMHLTNYSINKYSGTYQKNGISKRRLESVFEYISARHGLHEYARLWEEIKQIVAKTLVIAYPYISETKLKVENCFEILGFDVLIDNDLKPWILEVNHAPSFTAEEQSDLIVKYLVIDTSIAKVTNSPHDESVYDDIDVNDVCLNAAQTVYERNHRPTKGMMMRSEHQKAKEQKQRDMREEYLKKKSKAYKKSISTVKVDFSGTTAVSKSRRESIMQLKASREAIELPKINLTI